MIKTKNVSIYKTRVPVRVNYFLMQSYFDMPKQLRQLCNNMFLFEISKSVIHDIFEELIEVLKVKYNQLVTVVYDSPYAWMVINMNTKEFFKQYDQVIIEDDAEAQDQPKYNIL